MTRKGPLLTLLGGGALAVGLLIASINATGGQDDQDPQLAGEATPGAGPSGEPSAEPTEPAGEPEPVTYVGSVDGGGASVAVIIDGDEATAYVCDGGTVEAWLRGDARNGELLLDADNGSLVGSYDSEQADGETTVDGRDWTFTIDEVAPPEGLYQVADTVVGGAEVEGGWIVLPDGTQVGVLTVDGDSGPAPAIDPDTGDVDINGRTVTAERQG